jgi:hypothetical protein
MRGFQPRRLVEIVVSFMKTTSSFHTLEKFFVIPALPVIHKLLVIGSIHNCYRGLWTFIQEAC